MCDFGSLAPISGKFLSDTAIPASVVNVHTCNVETSVGAKCGHGECVWHCGKCDLFSSGDNCLKIYMCAVVFSFSFLFIFFGSFFLF